MTIMSVLKMIQSDSDSIFMGDDWLLVLLLYHLLRVDRYKGRAWLSS